MTGETLVKSSIAKVKLSIVLVMLMVLGNACLAPPQSEGNTSSVISSLEAEYIKVYSLGTSQIKCVTSNPDDGVVQFSWSCTGGNIVGEGSIVTWQSPSDYGDYYIMVIAKDKNGVSSKAVLTISVVPRPYEGCCGR